MKIFKKKNDTSIRVLQTLMLLSKKSASIQDIIRHFEKIDPQNRVYTNEVILKYINTLKVFGFRFEKEKDKHVLLNVPPRFNFNENELFGLNLLKKFINLFPEDEMKTKTLEFLNDVEHHFGDETSLRMQYIKKPSIKNLQFNYNKNQEKIKELEKYCIDGQKVKILHQKDWQYEIAIIAEPKEINYINNNVYFSVYNPISAEFQDIKIEDIIKVEQLPQKSNSITLPASATFRLKDRLAKAYKLKEDERLLNTDADGSVIIINQKEDRTMLLKRLMRYGENCEVLSPKILREEMRQLIKSTISNYEQ